MHMSETKMVKVRVEAKPEKGFFRCGRHWPKSVTEAEVPESDLSRLQAEKMLFVQVVPEAPPAPPAPAPKPEAPKAPAKAEAGKGGDGGGKTPEAPSKGG
jgi:hypothetical protein